MDKKKIDFINSLDQERVQTARMLCSIGPLMTVDAARTDILGIGKHPVEAIGESPLYLATEDYLFDLPAEEVKPEEEIKIEEPKLVVNTGEEAKIVEVPKTVAVVEKPKTHSTKKKSKWLK